MFRFLLFVILVSSPVFASAPDGLSCLYGLASFSGATEAHEVIDRYSQLVGEKSKGLGGYLRESWLGINFNDFYAYNWHRKAQILANRRFAAYLGRVLEQSETLRLPATETARLRAIQGESSRIADSLEAEVARVYDSSSGRFGFSVRRLDSRLSWYGSNTGEFERLAARAREVAGLLDAARVKLPNTDRLGDDTDELAFRQLAAIDSVQKKRQHYLTLLNRPSRIQFSYEVHTRRTVPVARYAATPWSLPYTEYDTRRSSYTETRYLSYAEAILWGYSSRNPAEALARQEAPFVSASQQAENLLDGLMRTASSSLQSSDYGSSRVRLNRTQLMEQRASLERYLRSTDADILALCSDDSPEVFRLRNAALLEWIDSLLERNAVLQKQLLNKALYLLPFPRS